MSHKNLNSHRKLERMTVSGLPGLWLRAVLFLPTALFLASSCSFRNATPLVAEAQGGESFLGQWNIDFDMEAPTLTFDPYTVNSPTFFSFQYLYTGTVVPEEKYFEVSILEHECWLPLSYPDALFVPDTEIDANNKKLRFDVVINEEKISSSSYFFYNGDFTADIKFCVRVDYRNAAEVVNWKEVNVGLRITYDERKDFSITGVLANTGDDDFNIIFIERRRTEAPTAPPTAAPTTPPSEPQQTLPPTEDEEGIFDDSGIWILVGGGIAAGGVLLCCIICCIVTVRRRKGEEEEDVEVVQNTNVVTIQIDRSTKELIAPTEQYDYHDDIVCEACHGDPHCCECFNSHDIEADIDAGGFSHTASETASAETSPIPRSISIPSASSSDSRSETSSITKSIMTAKTKSTTKSSKKKLIKKSSVQKSKKSTKKKPTKSSTVKSGSS